MPAGHGVDEQVIRGTKPGPLFQLKDGRVTDTGILGDRGILQIHLKYMYMCINTGTNVRIGRTWNEPCPVVALIK